MPVFFPIFTKDSSRSSNADDFPVFTLYPVSMLNLIKRIWQFIKLHKWKTVLAVIILLPVLSLVVFALSPAQPEYVTEAAERGDLQQTVEAVGTVISERDLQLQFPTTGIVSQVYIKEGDTVVQGQRLAALRAGNLSADIASASAQLLSAEADLRAKLEGARPEDIAIAEAEVANKRSSLASAKTTLKTAEESFAQSQQKLVALQSEADVSLSGYVSNVGSDATQELTAASNAIGVVRDVFSKNDVVDAIIKYSTTEYDLITKELLSIEQEFQSIYRSGVMPSDYEQALALLSRTRSSVARTGMAVDRAFNLLSALPSTSAFSETARESYKSTLASSRTTVQTSLSSLDSATKSLRDASATFSTRIATEEAAVISAQGTMDRAKSDIATYEATLKIAEAQLELKKAPTRQTDLDVARANVSQARAALQRAQANFGNTVLTAPIAGVVTKVNVKPGEYTPVDAAVTMLGSSPYRIETYVSEIDVPKVQLTQSGSIELDAFRDVHFKLRVSEIDTASTDRDGVPKYRVRLDFVHPHDELKIGMTGDAAIVTGIVRDVVTVPLRAVLENEDGESYVRILADNGTIEERVVTAGLEGEGGSVEVSDVQEGEIVIVLEKL